MGSDLFCGCGTDTVGRSTDPDVGTNFYCIIKEVKCFRNSISQGTIKHLVISW